MSSALQSYADRSVFRGLRATPVARGRIDYEFMWLLRRPMRATFDSRRGVLTFPALFPGAGVWPGVTADLQAVVLAVTGRGVPPHKRLDGRRAKISSSLRQGDWSLAVRIRGGNHEYAARRSLNLINDLFLRLRERYPDYLIETFGMSAE